MPGIGSRPDSSARRPDARRLVHFEPQPVARAVREQVARPSTSQHRARGVVDVRASRPGRNGRDCRRLLRPRHGVVHSRASAAGVPQRDRARKVDAVSAVDAAKVQHHEVARLRSSGRTPAHAAAPPAARKRQWYQMPVG